MQSYLPALLFSLFITHNCGIQNFVDFVVFSYILCGYVLFENCLFLRDKIRCNINFCKMKYPLKGLKIAIK